MVKKDPYSLLVKQCLKGKTKAQMSFYNIFYKTMYHTALRIIRNSADAEDVMQEAFISAFDNLKDVANNNKPVEAWLRRIVINKAIDFVRNANRHHEILFDEELLSENPFSNDNVPEESMSFNIESVRKELKALPEGYRIVTSLYLFEGYDHEEIAEILNISASTSRSQFSRAKKLLLTNLKNTQSNA